MDKAKDIFKKYWVGIICAVVALASVITASVVLAGYHDELRTKLTGSANKHQTLSGLLNAPRNQPLLPDQEEPKPLEQFPSQAVITWGESLVKTIDEQSKEALRVVIEKNRQQPLVRGVLPNPAGVASLDYRNAYIARLDPASPTSLQKAVLRGTLPPTAEELQKEKDRIYETEYRVQIRTDPLTNAPLNETEVKHNFEEKVASLPWQMRDQRAQQNLMYVETGAISMDKDVSNRTGGTPTPEQIWWSQLALWVQGNVADGLARANAGSKNVGESPVKRLYRIELPIGPAMLFLPAGKVLAGPNAGFATGGQPMPAAATPDDPNKPIVLDHKLSSTGRTSGGMYDVVQFRLDMVVAAKDLPMIIKTLSTDRLLTVLNIETLAAEDASAAEAQGYMYGKDPVVRVTMKCEILFLREWTTPLMPKSIKDMLGVAPPPEQQPQ